MKFSPQGRNIGGKGEGSIKGNVEEGGRSIKGKEVPKRESEGWKVAWRGSVLKKETSHLEGFTGRSHSSDQDSSRARIDWTEAWQQEQLMKTPR